MIYHKKLSDLDCYMIRISLFCHLPFMGERFRSCYLLVDVIGKGITENFLRMSIVHSRLYLPTTHSF